MTLPWLSGLTAYARWHEIVSQKRTHVPPGANPDVSALSFQHVYTTAMLYSPFIVCALLTMYCRTIFNKSSDGLSRNVDAMVSGMLICVDYMRH